MSKSRFAGLKEAVQPLAEAGPISVEGAKRKFREGKKAVMGYFSPELSRGMHRLAIDNGVTMQALLGEAIDDLMRKYGKHPFGER